MSLLCKPLVVYTCICRELLIREQKIITYNFGQDYSGTVTLFILEVLCAFNNYYYPTRIRKG